MSQSSFEMKRKYPRMFERLRKFVFYPSGDTGLKSHYLYLPEELYDEWRVNGLPPNVYSFGFMQRVWSWSEEDIEQLQKLTTKDEINNLLKMSE